jgi:hypothetical protein
VQHRPNRIESAMHVANLLAHRSLLLDQLLHEMAVAVRIQELLGQVGRRGAMSEGVVMGELVMAQRTVVVVIRA